MEAEQRKIAMIQQKAQMMQARANQFINEDPDAQAAQIASARNQLAQEAQGEAEMAKAEAELENNPDDN